MKNSPMATRRHGENPTADASGGGGDQIVIRLPHPMVLRVIARSVLLTAVILAFPWLRSALPPTVADSILSFPSPSMPHRRADDDLLFLPMLLRDLRREGLLVACDRGSAVFLGNPGTRRLAFVKQNRMFPVMSELGRMAVPDRSVDFVIATDGFGAASFVFIERVLKIGGVTIIRLSPDPSQIFRLPANFRIVYIRQFGSTIVGIKKMAHASSHKATSTADFLVNQINRKLLASPGPETEMLNGLDNINAADFLGNQIGRNPIAYPQLNTKVLNEIASTIAADSETNQIGRKLLSVPKSNRYVFKELENALLWSPFDSKQSNRFHKRTRHHGDMMGRSTNEYNREMFIDVGMAGRATSENWSEEQYPKRNSEFEIIKLDVAVRGSDADQTRCITEWLMRNVKEEDFVVMKAEIEVSEDLPKEKVNPLMDDLYSMMEKVAAGLTATAGPFYGGPGLRMLLPTIGGVEKEDQDQVSQ